MEDVFGKATKCKKKSSRQPRIYVPFPGADVKYEDGKDWRVYNPDKYQDPNWSPDKE